MGQEFMLQVDTFEPEPSSVLVPIYPKERPWDILPPKGTNSYNPLIILTHEYKDIWNDMKKSKNWYHKFMYAFGAPGWSHDGSTLTIKQQRKLQKSK